MTAAATGALASPGTATTCANRPGATVSQGLRDSFWLQGMQAALKGVFDCITAFSETDFTEDLKKFGMPTLVVHGDDDQIVPIGASARLSSSLIANARLEVYKGAPHGLYSTHKDRVKPTCCPSFRARADDPRLAVEGRARAQSRVPRGSPRARVP